MSERGTTWQSRVEKGWPGTEGEGEQGWDSLGVKARMREGM